jgi:hypothetical protein
MAGTADLQHLNFRRLRALFTAIRAALSRRTATGLTPALLVVFFARHIGLPPRLSCGCKDHFFPSFLINHAVKPLLRVWVFVIAAPAILADLIRF